MRRNNLTEKFKEFEEFSEDTTVVILYVLYYYAFPTGSVYGFGIKWRRRRQRRTPTISESASNITSNIKILHIVNKAGLFHILFGVIKF